jgi:hypothetical protein
VNSFRDSTNHQTQLAYVTWEWMKLDNAKANLTDETLTALCEFVGCLADAGPMYSPDERPYIERFFGTIASRLCSRLPGYTGSQPRDLRRALADPKGMKSCINGAASSESSIHANNGPSFIHQTSHYCIFRT